MAKNKANESRDDQPEFIYVTSGRSDDRIVLHEVDDAHPGGSVLVAGDMVRKVAPTAYVLEQLRAKGGEGLVEVKDGKSMASADKFLDERRDAFEKAGMVTPAEVAGDRPVVNEGLNPEEEDGQLDPAGALTDPSRAGTGSQPTQEEKDADAKAKG